MINSGGKKNMKKEKSTGVVEMLGLLIGCISMS